jgi:hypothetical protein
MTGAPAPQKQSFIFCAGLIRSGSTALFNIIRQLLTAEGISVHAAWHADYQIGSPATVHLVKYHTLPAPMAQRLAQAKQQSLAQVFLSKRDLRDVAISAIGMGWRTEDDSLIESLGKHVAEYQQWLPFADHVMRYEDYLAAPEAEVARIAAALGLPENPARDGEIFRIVDAEGKDSKEAATDQVSYDRATLLHPGHRQSGKAGRYRDELSPAFVRRIEERYGDWLRANGYEV